MSFLDNVNVKENCVKNSKNIYFNGLKCFLDTYSSATYMR